MIDFLFQVKTPLLLSCHAVSGIENTLLHFHVLLALGTGYMRAFW